VLKLPTPEHLITAESVIHGKPDPEGYLLGRSRLGLTDPSKQVVVFEDSPAGIKAGKAAGCKVVGLVTSHTAEQVLAAEPDWVMRDLKDVTVVPTSGDDSRVTLEIRNAMVVKSA